MAAFDVREHRRDLLDPHCYPGAPSEISLNETHISCVFLAGDLVYKLKKPVDFGFVDYSTVSRRRRFCELEVILNRRLSEGIYLGAVPLVRTADGLRFEAHGRLVDWAVKMRRVPDAALWRSRLAAGTLGPLEMERLGRFLADFHRRAPPVRSPTALAAWDLAWDGNLRELDRFAGTFIPRDLLDRAANRGAERRARLAPVLRGRLRGGRFVDGHGDLRLEHLCDLDGRLQALDCIEFNPALRRVDAASDLAFLLMDLDRGGRADLALALCAAYLRASGDATLPLCDRYYRAERALVRAKVDALAQEGDRSDADRRRLRERAGRWVALASGYLAPRLRPALIVVRGVSGSGKTTLATRLAAELGCAWLASDYFRKQAAGVAPEERLSAGAYTPQARRAVYARLHRAAGRLLAHGFPVLLDATYLEPETQAAAAALARRHGVPALALTLHAEPAMLAQRLRERAPTASDAGWDIARAQLSQATGAPFRGVDEVLLDASGPPEAMLQAALSAVRPLLESETAQG